MLSAIAERQRLSGLYLNQSNRISQLKIVESQMDSTVRNAFI
jgi:hypothetical protein